MYTSDRFRMLRQMGLVLMDGWGRVIVTLLYRAWLVREEVGTSC
jgi:hypothetical protein